MLPKTVERRTTPAKIEVRGEGLGVFYGRAVVYNAWSELLFGAFRERILPGAFDESLKSGQDIYASLDHDEQRLLGRLSAGTLRLKPGPEGIDVEIDGSEYTYARDLAVAIRRGDLRGMSFVFDVTDDKWETRDGVPHRSVSRADIFEVAYVFHPAYTQTETGLRHAWPVEGEKRAILRASLHRLPSLATRRRELRVREA